MIKNKLSQKRYIGFRMFLNCAVAILLFLMALKFVMVDVVPFSELDGILCFSFPNRVLHIEDAYPCPRNGIITVMQGGRLGNQIWEYASVWAAARETGLDAYVPNCIWKKLNRMFSGLTLPSLAYISHCNVSMKKWIKDPNIHRDNRTKLVNLLRQNTNTTNIVVLPIYVTLVEEVVKHLADIKTELTIRSKLKKRSRIMLLDATEAYDVPITYVGVHVRRTDYEDYLQRFDYYLAGSSFFYNAMAYFESKYYNVAFIVVSDDPDWCRDNLLYGRRNVHIMSDEYGSPELDLSLMASCNHSIIDYGTYGVWGAIFAGGETIVYNVTHKTTDTITNLMPLWTFMD